MTSNSKFVRFFVYAAHLLVLYSSSLVKNSHFLSEDYMVRHQPPTLKGYRHRLSIIMHMHMNCFRRDFSIHVGLQHVHTGRHSYLIEWICGLNFSYSDTVYV